MEEEQQEQATPKAEPKAKETRSHFINVRYSESEINAIDKSRTTFSRSDFIRNLTLNEIKVIAPPSTKRKNESNQSNDEINLLKNIANNVNQIAKYSNQTKASPSIEIIKEIQREIHMYLEKKFYDN